MKYICPILNVIIILVLINRIKVFKASIMIQIDNMKSRKARMRSKQLIFLFFLRLQKADVLFLTILFLQKSSFFLCLSQIYFLVENFISVRVRDLTILNVIHFVHSNHHKQNPSKSLAINNLLLFHMILIYINCNISHRHCSKLPYNFFHFKELQNHQHHHLIKT